ncbi:putative mediator of RNA polymerase II transcription subunit 26 isoform X1 [Drosophila sulfurigaster albostrigata]|uniref:putative mediator of RNA polymerase II transcription subunit 26 isoform X1 n=1 Tax=Drosophila nasuta TaxID=42062 RepID=UPI00295F4A31|nr:putative mediator of RNA polymerase II transcription subunit 26 isoform X1 [Drosophila nasuta]XP_062125944.1 putative mediator of RNA polymerase II transcription subunit 26 isoform X1 [Drosophila sulfurigaster albostrigata]
MHLTDFTAALLLALLSCSSAQRVAPGVNPQHYQQVPQQVPQHHQQPPPPPQYQQQQQIHSAPGVPQQQYQQQQVQYQQVPVQQQQQVPQMQQQHIPQQQVPQQQHPQQVQHQQQQQHHGGGHHHGQPQQVLNTGNIQQERAHIQEHMQVPIDTSKMSEAELQFHYFKMHDSDNNNKLDGCELIKSLIHWHEQGSKEQPNGEKPHVEEKVFSDEELVALIDPILQMDDTSRDGFIDYPEFIKAQQKAAEKMQQQQQHPDPAQQQQQQHQQQQHQQPHH